jgi:hypothetical protein
MGGSNRLDRQIDSYLGTNHMHTKRIRHTITKSPVIRPSLSWLYHRRLTASDIFVASYPRAGSTWLRFLLYELLTGQPTSFAAVNQAIPGIGRHFTAPRLIHETRLIQTHEPYRSAYGRALYLVRDMRDVVISEYHFQQLWQLYDGSFPDFIGDFLAGRVNRYGTWESHTNSWLDAQEAAPSRILLIRFDDLRYETRATLTRILTYLGAPASDEVIAQAIDNNTTHKMRAKESALKFAAADQNFVRQGQVGGWRNTLSDEQQLLLEQEAGPTLCRLGYLQAPKENQQLDFSVTAS